MTKENYLSIRSKLNFSAQPRHLRNHVLLDGCLLGVAASSIFSLFPPLYWFGQALLAIFYFRSFSIMHEAVHGILSKNKRVNDRLGWIYGAFCFLPFQGWRDIHLQHHYWAGNVERDPTMKLVKEFSSRTIAEQNFMNIIWKSWLPYFALLQHVVFWQKSLSDVLQVKKGRRRQAFASVLPVAFLVGLLIAPLFFGRPFLFVPSLVLYLALVETVNFPHHLDLPLFSGSQRLELWNQTEISRSCVYPRVFEKYAFLNFNYHSEHHLYPTLPWHELRHAHKLIKKHNLKELNLSAGNLWIAENRKTNLNELVKNSQKKRAA